MLAEALCSESPLLMNETVLSQPGCPIVRRSHQTETVHLLQDPPAFLLLRRQSLHTGYDLMQ